MDIIYNLKEDDYVNFNMYHINHSKTGVRTLKIQRYLPPAIIVTTFLLMVIILDSSLGVMLTMSILMSISWIFFFPKYFQRSVKQNVKKMLREGDNNGMLGKQHLIMNEEGVVVNSKFGETKVSWEGLKKFTEDQNYLYLYVGAMNAFLIPKQQLSNIAEVKKYLNSKFLLN